MLKEYLQNPSAPSTETGPHLLKTNTHDCYRYQQKIAIGFYYFWRKKYPNVSKIKIWLHDMSSAFLFQHDRDRWAFLEKDFQRKKRKIHLTQVLQQNVKQRWGKRKTNMYKKRNLFLAQATCQIKSFNLQISLVAQSPHSAILSVQGKMPVLWLEVLLMRLCIKMCFITEDSMLPISVT